MIERVAEIISIYNMFAPGRTVGVAVSGGADSVALLHALVELAPRWNLRLKVLHLNHKLRGEESGQDACFVARLAEDLRLPLVAGEVDVAALAAAGRENLEQAARKARRGFLLDCIAAGQVDRVATAHTLSDQAETVLYRILRGAGTAGLASIRPVTGDGFTRPMLGVTRAEVLEFLQRRRLAWREDRSNRDLRFARNRIRHQLLPSLERDWNPALQHALARMAFLAYEDEQYWREVIDSAASCVLRRGAAVEISRRDLLKFPPALQSRLARRMVEMVKGDLRGIDFQHIDRMLALARSPAGEHGLQLPGARVRRSLEWIRVEAAGNSPAEAFQVVCTPPQTIPLPGGESSITLQVEPMDGDSRAGRLTGQTGYNLSDCIDWERVSGVLILRGWRPGDRYRPAGAAKIKKLKDLFLQAEVPSWYRPDWPVITVGDDIIWSRRFGPAEGLQATPASRTVLRICEHRSGCS